MVTTVYHEASQAQSDDASASSQDPASPTTTLYSEVADLALSDATPSLSLHPLPSKDALIVKIQPPRTPKSSLQGLRRTPCDIVLAIDVSGSMCAAATAPSANPATDEDYGLSVLDLTKHAARTILATLDDHDRLGIVAFSREATVIQNLVAMTEEAKTTASENIDKLRPLGATNLWHGIVESVQMFRSAEKTEDDTQRVPAIMVLTDGVPNYMCPAQGYVAKLGGMLPGLPAPIHTFGFGYSIRSGLLKSISEITGGNYAFIPDAGMIGTVFVHAVANLQATYAHNATLLLEHSAEITIEETTGATVRSRACDDAPANSTTISLGPILFGQSRDLYLRLRPNQPLGVLEKCLVTAELSYSRMTGPIYSTSAVVDLQQPVAPLSEAEVAYHESRSQLCAYLSTLFPTDGLGEHKQVEIISEKHLQGLRDLISNIPARLFDDKANQSLMEDLSGPDPKGQVSLAITSQTYWTQWGGHYLLSLLNAHTRQYCNSFKDPGPLQYGADSPLFIQCRDRLDTAFDTIPPPEPSRPTRLEAGHGAISMSHYNSVDNPCFAGSTLVTLASGHNVPIRSLRRGSEVLTPLGPRKVAAVLVTPVEREIMCRVGGLVVTPWHPVSTDGKTWAFPAQLAESAVRYTGCIYSLLLQPDRISTAHAVHVGGVWGVTLGHGVLSGRDVRAHPFFGDFNAVVKSLRAVGVRRNGLVVGGGIRRDEKSGLVSGFRRGSGRIPASILDVKRASRGVE